MITNTKQNINEKIRLQKAYINYNDIIDKRLPFKFAYIDEWILKKSKKLLEEAEQIKNQNNTLYRVFKRGTIIKADFGVGLGSEMSQVHFAIVLNNYDNPKNNTLTVIPLTSKEDKFNLYLGSLIIEKLINKIKKELINLGINEENNESKSITNEIKAKKLNTLLSYYKSNIKNTYACCNLITTISKTRIIKPINEYDTIGKARCSSDIMKKIDNEIINKFTTNV